MPNWVLPLLSWIISSYFLIGFLMQVGFRPETTLTIANIIHLAIFLFFLFLPFFNKIKIGKLLELEREIEQTKNEVAQVRENVQQNFSLLSSSISMISNVSSQVTVNLPNAATIEENKKKLEKETESASPQEIAQIKSELTLENEDTLMALARTRMMIEHLLRSILGKRTEVKEIGDRPLKLMGLTQLFKLFIEEFPHHKELEGAVSYVNKVCSAAIHAQRFPQSHADEALEMGARIISVLDQILKETHAVK